MHHDEFSQTIQLIYRQRKVASTEFNRVNLTSGGRVVLDPDVDAIHLVARKTGVTRTVQHIHLYFVEIRPAPDLTGCAL